jgi:hypothetical protein
MSQRSLSCRANLTRDWDELQRRLGGGEQSQGQQKGANAIGVHGITVDDFTKNVQPQLRYTAREAFPNDAIIGLASPYIHQKSVNARQIIPMFTFFWDDKPKSKRKKTGMAPRPSGFPAVLVPFQNLARFHDEATTSDDGGDTGDQFNIASGADEHGKKANYDQKACYKEGTCRDSGRTPDPGAAGTDAEPAGSNRRSQTGKR